MFTLALTLGAAAVDAVKGDEEPPAPNVTALVMACDQTALFSDGVRRVAALRLRNETQRVQSFRLEEHDSSVRDSIGSYEWTLSPGETRWEQYPVIPDKYGNGPDACANLRFRIIQD